jgi:hypothetical protein
MLKLSTGELILTPSESTSFIPQIQVKGTIVTAKFGQSRVEMEGKK